MAQSIFIENRLLEYDSCTRILKVVLFADAEKWSRIWAKDLGIIPIKTFKQLGLYETFGLQHFDSVLSWEHGQSH